MMGREWDETVRNVRHVWRLRSNRRHDRPINDVN